MTTDAVDLNVNTATEMINESLAVAKTTPRDAARLPVGEEEEEEEEEEVVAEEEEMIE